MNKKNITEAIDLVNLIIEDLENGGWAGLDNVTTKSDMVRLAARYSVLFDIVKDKVRTDLQNGETIPGAKLGKDSATNSVSDWPAVKKFMIATYKSNPDDLDKFASISMTNLYTLERAESGVPDKKEDAIKKLYSKYITTSVRQGSLKLS